MKNNKIIDLFCGCGGLSLGFEMAGFEPVLAIDFWEDAIKTYNHNSTKNIAICKDITLMQDKEFKQYRGKVVGVIGGPPCQGFSTVGKRDVEDPRNKLYQEYLRIVSIVEPEFFVLENVKGLTTLNKGSFKKSIIDDFSKLGYTVQYDILNAADYGIPQNRERVFFIGFKNGIAFRFPKKENNYISCRDAIADLISGDYGPITTEYQRMMRGGCKKPLNHKFTDHTEQTKKVIAMVPNGGSILDLPIEYWKIRRYNKAFERMDSEKPANTVDCGHRNYFHYSENRIPTARENARIQSFPDQFEFLGTKSSQYKQIGNAVPPFLAKRIAEIIRSYLEVDSHV